VSNYINESLARPPFYSSTTTVKIITNAISDNVKCLDIKIAHADHELLYISRLVIIKYIKNYCILTTFNISSISIHLNGTTHQNICIIIKRHKFVTKLQKIV